jgi:hypothetical protein
MPWIEFLKSQAIDLETYTERLVRIESWRSRAEKRKQEVDAAKAESIINRAIAAYEVAVAELRCLRDSSGPFRPNQLRE